MQIWISQLTAAATLSVVMVFLGGCGQKPGPSPSPTPSNGTTTTTPTTTTTTTPQHKGWSLNPIVVRGHHMYDSVTKQQFHGVGIAMPNCGDDVSNWIAVLQRIKKESPAVNLVRIYVPPLCATNSTCFKEFFQEADKLGVYVLVPGTGTIWGWLPGPGACSELNECYKKGQVLGWGQTMVQYMNYPNTLAIVIGNEFDQQMPQYMAVLKAYARDMKAYMQMCNDDQQSPSFQKMRQVPLLYASSDAHGDNADAQKAAYLFCDDASVSIDIFGLNIERWCDAVGGPVQYKNVNKWVSDGNFPGAFIFSEMGCAQLDKFHRTRSWKQLEGIFSNSNTLDGFIAYTYSGNPDFDMFSSGMAGATIKQDGINFFHELSNMGQMAMEEPGSPSAPTCPSTIGGAVLVGSYKDIKAYDTGKTGWSTHCPKPYEEGNVHVVPKETVVV